MKTTAIRNLMIQVARGRVVSDTMYEEALAEVEAIEQVVHDWHNGPSPAIVATPEQLARLNKRMPDIRGPVCVGVGGRCHVHDRPMGADLLCEVGRGGPLALPEPTAQRKVDKPRPSKAKNLRPRGPGRR